MKRRNRCLILILLIVISNSVKAQLKLPGEAPPKWVTNLDHFVDVPTPTASSLGTYGDIGISYFTGRPNISVPLYNIKVKDISMPITLDYDASGVMPNSLPTWVGQNWTLNVGGVITRNRHGNYDEWIASQQAQGVCLGIAHNYFEYHSKLPILMNKPENDYSDLKEAITHGGEYDMSPDEFTFNFMGKSGKFFLDTNGNWSVQSKDNIEVIFDVNKSSNFTSPFYPKYPNGELQPRSIAGFILRDDNGYEYQFGYVQNAIEYNTNFWCMSVSEYRECWHAMSWYLTKVSDKYGNELFSLKYKRGAYVIQVFNCSFSNGVYGKYSGVLATEAMYSYNNNDFPYSISINSPVYLQSIKTLNGLLINLSSCCVEDKMGTEHLYKKLYDRYNGVSGLYQVLAHNVSGWVVGGEAHDNRPSKRGFYYLQEDDDSLYKFRHNPPSFFNKGIYRPSGIEKEIREDLLSYSRLERLSSIVIQPVAKEKVISKIAFRLCTSIVNKRLCLDSVLIQDNEGIMPHGVKNAYRFKYNEFERLPADYLTTAVDHWGYYNGRPYEGHLSNINTVRAPDSKFTALGVLNKIIYPTGGCSVLDYEPNTYGKRLKYNRQDLELCNGIGGGLRIKSIKIYETEDMRRLLSERDYSYNIPRTSVSSGELFALPFYSWNYDIKCIYGKTTYSIGTSRSSSIVPLANSSGPSTGYSYVTESIKVLGNIENQTEKHIYHFSNLSTEGAKDQPFVLTFGYTDKMTPNDEYSDMGFKRGLLLKEEVINNDGRKVQATAFKYRTDEDNYLKQYSLTTNLRQESFHTAQFAHYLGGVYKIYYPKYDVVEQRDTIFPEDGSSPIVTVNEINRIDKVYTTWYPYKHDMNIRLTVGRHTKRAYSSEEYLYQFGDFMHCKEEDSLLYKKMFDIKPLKVVHYRDGKLESLLATKYEKLYGKEIVVPYSIMRTNYEGKIDTLVRSISYTNTGVPYFIRELGKPTTYLKWGYNDCYLLVKSDTYVPIGISNEEFLDSEQCQNKLQQYITTAPPGTVAYSYNILLGITSIMQANGNKTTYKYNSFGDLQGIFDYSGRLLKKYQYHYRK